jgi:hypothetical protein
MLPVSVCGYASVTGARGKPLRASDLGHELEGTSQGPHGRALAAREGFVTYELTIENKPGYLHVIVTGDNTRENVVRYMEEVVRACTLRQCFRVLIEERLDGPRLGTLDVFEMVSTGSTRFLRTLQAMAYVDVNAHSQEMMQFAENVAVNRAFPVRVFPTVLAAERWLEAEQQQSISPGAAAALAPAAGKDGVKHRR